MTAATEGMACIGGPGCFCEGRRYTCPGCERSVPECNGSHADDPLTDPLCDQCWHLLEEYRRMRRQMAGGTP